MTASVSSVLLAWAILLGWFAICVAVMALVFGLGFVWLVDRLDRFGRFVGWWRLRHDAEMQKDRHSEVNGR